MNNWLTELKISKEKTISSKINKNNENLIPIDNNSISKDPESKLIDKRFDKVKDWKKLENDSNKERINKNTSNGCKKRKKRKEHNNQPKEK